MVERNFKAVCIKPTSPSHFGEKGIGIENVTPCPHSDTIFSAICSAYLQLFGVEELQKMLAQFRENPPFLISSAFPYYDGDEAKIYFFPKPLVPALLEEEILPIKELKELSLLSESAFKTFILGGVESLLTKLKNGELEIRDKLMLNKDESRTLKVDRLYEVYLRPRNRLRRLDVYSQLYYVGATRYLNSGMFFLIDLKCQETLHQIIPCLNLLSDEGLGGQRTIGYGRFKYEIRTFSLKDAEDADAFLTLSLYHPTSGEVDAFLKASKKWYFKCITRTGYLQSPLIGSPRLKPPLRMILEGSIIPKIEEKIFGDFPLVLDEPQHPVYKYGYAFPIGVKV